MIRYVSMGAYIQTHLYTHTEVYIHIYTYVSIYINFSASLLTEMARPDILYMCRAEIVKIQTDLDGAYHIRLKESTLRFISCYRAQHLLAFGCFYFIYLFIF